MRFDHLRGHLLIVNYVAGGCKKGRSRKRNKSQRRYNKKQKMTKMWNVSVQLFIAPVDWALGYLPINGVASWSFEHARSPTTSNEYRHVIIKNWPR